MNVKYYIIHLGVTQVDRIDYELKCGRDKTLDYDRCNAGSSHIYFLCEL